VLSPEGPCEGALPPGAPSPTGPVAGAIWLAWDASAGFEGCGAVVGAELAAEAAGCCGCASGCGCCCGCACGDCVGSGSAPRTVTLATAESPFGARRVSRPIPASPGTRATRNSSVLPPLPASIVASCGLAAPCAFHVTFDPGCRPLPAMSTEIEALPCGSIFDPSGRSVRSGGTTFVMLGGFAVITASAN
jgi:hypothetical protein